jgi:hypothetical protein
MSSCNQNNTRATLVDDASRRKPPLLRFCRVHHASNAEVEPLPLAAAAASCGLLPAHHPAALAVALAAGNIDYVSAAVRVAMHNSSQVNRVFVLA